MTKPAQTQRTIKDLIEELRKKDPSLADEFTAAMEHEYEVRLPAVFQKTAHPTNSGVQARGDNLGSGCKVNVKYSGHCWL